jgi:predicted lipoprotein with Yx(FWY)xxD motif
MRRALGIAVIAGSALVALVGAGSADQWTPAGAATKEQATKLKLKRSPYGRVLFANGYALYLFSRDQGAESKCYGECAEAWPPLEARGELKGGRGVKERLLGTTTRDDGSEQLTYDGHPLYGYVDDPRGEVFCHDVVEYGGTWYAVRKSGKPAPSAERGGTPRSR